MELDEESWQYVVINTHRGLYRYLRLPFGIASVPAIFQQTMDMIYQGIQGVLCYMNDVLIVGKTREEHFSTLEEVFKRLQKGLKLSNNKCHFLVRTVEYLGFKIDANGLHATGQNLDALLEAPIPTSVQQRRSFLRLVSYYSKFIPNLATLLHPLNALLKKMCGGIGLKSVNKRLRKLSSVVLHQMY